MGFFRYFSGFTISTRSPFRLIGQSLGLEPLVDVEMQIGFRFTGEILVDELRGITVTSRLIKRDAPLWKSLRRQLICYFIDCHCDDTNLINSSESMNTINAIFTTQQGYACVE